MSNQNCHKSLCVCKQERKIIKLNQKEKILNKTSTRAPRNEMTSNRVCRICLQTGVFLGDLSDKAEEALKEIFKIDVSKVGFCGKGFKRDTFSGAAGRSSISTMCRV